MVLVLGSKSALSNTRAFLPISQQSRRESHQELASIPEEEQNLEENQSLTDEEEQEVQDSPDPYQHSSDLSSSDSESSVLKPYRRVKRHNSSASNSEEEEDDKTQASAATNPSSNSKDSSIASQPPFSSYVSSSPIKRVVELGGQAQNQEPPKKKIKSRWQKETEVGSNSLPIYEDFLVDEEAQTAGRPASISEINQQYKSVQQSSGKPGPGGSVKLLKKDVPVNMPKQNSVSSEPSNQLFEEFLAFINQQKQINSEQDTTSEASPPASPVREPNYPVSAPLKKSKEKIGATNSQVSSPTVKNQPHYSSHSKSGTGKITKSQLNKINKSIEILQRELTRAFASQQ